MRRLVHSVTAFVLHFLLASALYGRTHSILLRPLYARSGCVPLSRPVGSPLAGSGRRLSHARAGGARLVSANPPTRAVNPQRECTRRLARQLRSGSVSPGGIAGASPAASNARVRP